MPSSYASLFDDLLASNEKQMNEVMGGASNAFPTPPGTQQRNERSPHSMKNETATEAAETTIISGTANGVAFKLTV